MNELLKDRFIKMIKKIEDEIDFCRRCYGEYDLKQSIERIHNITIKYKKLLEKE